MENEFKGKSLLWGIIGGGAAVALSALLSAILAACFMGTDDPNGFVTAIALASLALGGAAGGFVAVKKGGALVSAAVTSVTALIIMALLSLLVPQSEGLVSRLLPPVITAISPLLGGSIGGHNPDSKKKSLSKIKKKMKVK